MSYRKSRCLETDHSNLKSTTPATRRPIISFIEDEDKRREVVRDIKKNKSICNTERRTLGSKEFWANFPVDFDFVVKAELENQLVGFLVIQKGFKCFSETPKPRCIVNAEDTWYIYLICSSGGVGGKMIDVVKKEANKHGVKYITLSAIESVLTYYWSKHNFLISTTCTQSQEFETLLINLNGAIKKINELRSRKVQLESKRASLGYQTRQAGVESIKIRNEIDLELKATEENISIYELERSDHVQKIVNSGMYTENLKNGGNINEQNKATAASDGIYMTFCMASDDIHLHKKYRGKRAQSEVD